MRNLRPSAWSYPTREYPSGGRFVFVSRMMSLTASDVVSRSVVLMQIVLFLDAFSAAITTHHMTTTSINTKQNFILQFSAKKSKHCFANFASEVYKLFIAQQLLL